MNPVAQIAEILSTPEDKSEIKPEGDTEVKSELEGAANKDNTAAPLTDNTDDKVIEGEDEDGVVDDTHNIDEENSDGKDTLNALADELEVPVSDLYELNVKMKEGEPKTLGALKDFYEANKDVDGLRANILEQESSLQEQSALYT